MTGIKKRIRKILSIIVNSNELLKYVSVRVWNRMGQWRYEKKYASACRVDDRLIVFESFAGKQYSCNPRALYEELLRDPRYRSYKKVWAFRDPERHRGLERNPNTKVVAYRSPEYYRAFASAKVWVSNFRLGDELQPKPGQIYIQTWHGTPLKRLGFDIASFRGSRWAQRELEYQYTTDVKRYRYFLSPSPYYREKLSSALRLMDYHGEELFIDGCYPRNDALLRLTDEQIAQHRKRLGIPEGKRVILYAPTWRETEHDPGDGYVYHLAVDFGKWRRALGEDVLILYRSHYLISNSIDLRPYEGFVRNVSDYDDINDLYAVSDLLITDYSSVFFDYANLKRPMVFFMYDYENYRNELRGFYIGEEELPGPVVREEDALLRLLADYHGEGYEERCEAFNRKFNPHSEGGGAAVVWNTVLPRKKAE